MSLKTEFLIISGRHLIFMSSKCPMLSSTTVYCHSVFFMLQIELFPLPPLYVDVLNPSISECDLVWKQSLYRGKQVNERSLGHWTLVSLSKGEIWTQIHREGRQCEETEKMAIKS